MPTALISGANRGIGLEFCKQLKGKGYQIIGLCRTGSDELNALADVVIEDTDVTDLPSLRSAAEQLSSEKIDLLINNAGILHKEDFPGLDYDSILRQFEVNAMGPLKVTEAFLPNLDPGAKVVVLTSRMGSTGDNSSGGYFGYRMSKAAVNIAFMSLAHALKEKGITVGILHPSSVQTAMTRFEGLISPETSVEGLLARINELKTNALPEFIDYTGRSIPW